MAEQTKYLANQDKKFYPIVKSSDGSISFDGQKFEQKHNYYSGDSFDGSGTFFSPSVDGFDIKKINPKGVLIATINGNNFTVEVSCPNSIFFNSDHTQIEYFNFNGSYRVDFSAENSSLIISCHDDSSNDLQISISVVFY